ncbi:zinc ABC transporter substrate-binding protein [Verrucomicrobiales bacterium]|nr:zinc ABC transporter substrate-binding protein [Verrucomicrobiales bacterium]MDA7926699.1 zinc ABC transporter substrate-binding protein [Verrucomicrobiales bacterium]
MRPLNLIPLCLTLLFAALSASCDKTPSVPAPVSGKPTVFVPVAPYAFLVESIGGDFFDVQTLASESDDPHTFSPTPKDVVQLSSAQVYFTAELPFERALLEKLEESKFAPLEINLINGLETLDGSCDHPSQDDHSHDDHDHEHSHDDHDHSAHDHSGLDPHVWLSPAHLIEQVSIISSALRELTDSAEEKEQIDERTLELIFNITATDKELVTALAPMRGETFYVYHGAFGYFARAYGLVQKSVELNGRSPEPKALVNLIEQAKKDEVSVIFVQPQFDSTSAKALAEAIDGKVIPIDPLAKNVLENLISIAEKISEK